MTFLLDTNVISELRRFDKTHPRVAAWSDGVAPEDQFLSVISILEIEIGALRVHRRDPAQSAILRSWIDGWVLPAFDGRIIPIDTPVARKCAALHVPNPRAERDALIAATALVHGLTIVTRNVGDFGPMGVKLLDPWR